MWPSDLCSPLIPTWNPQNPPLMRGAVPRWSYKPFKNPLKGIRRVSLEGVWGDKKQVQSSC